MEFLTQAAIFFGAAVIVVPIFRRLGLGAVLGYLVAGALIGPYGLKLFTDVDAIQHFGEFGVVLLLFIIGLELQPSRLWTMRTAVFGLGGAQVAVTGAVLGADRGRLRPRPAHGRRNRHQPRLFVHSFRPADLGRARRAERPFRPRGLRHPAVPGSGRHPDAGHCAAARRGLCGGKRVSSVVLTIVKIAAVLAVVVVGGNFLLRPVLRSIAKTRTPELFTATALLIVAGTSLLMDSVGISMSLGAFLAGVLLANSEFRHELEADIDPFKGLLLGLFFISVGMGLDLKLLRDQFGKIALIVLALMAIKGVVMFGLGRAWGMNTHSAKSLALALPQGGEFAFVIFTAAGAAQLITHDTQQLLVLVVSLSMAATPLLSISNDWMTRGFVPPPEDHYSVAPPDERPVIIAGFGRVGQIIGRVLAAKKIGFTALDASAEQVDFVRTFGNKIYFGDASRPDLLRAAKADKAKILVIAVDDVEASLRIAETVTLHFPKLKIVARARNRQHAYRLMDLGSRCCGARRSCRPSISRVRCWSGSACVRRKPNAPSALSRRMMRSGCSSITPTTPIRTRCADWPRPRRRNSRRCSRAMPPNKPPPQIPSDTADRQQAA